MKLADAEVKISGSVPAKGSKCELCKCLNLIAEGRKHPSQTVWQALTSKYGKIRNREAKSLSSFCEAHRSPLRLSTDVQAVGAFIADVFERIDRILAARS